MFFFTLGILLPIIAVKVHFFIVCFLNSNTCAFMCSNSAFERVLLMTQVYLAALAGFGNLRTEVRPEMLTTFPPQLSESFFSLFLT